MFYDADERENAATTRNQEGEHAMLMRSIPEIMHVQTNALNEKTEIREASRRECGFASSRLRGFAARA
jgi:tRNA(Phe) wybutosine-synthesizing methylase Tyw3